MSTASTRAIAGVVLLVSVVTAGTFVSPTAAFDRFEWILGDPVLFGLVVAGLYLVRPLFAWPTTPLAAVVGYGYGIPLGVPVALVGVVVTVIPVFLVARWVVDGETRPAARGRSGGVVGSVLERTGDAIDRYYRTAGPLRGVVASRLAPIPSDVATCAAAASDVRLRYLVFGTVVGELPWTVAAVVVGASTATVTTDGLGELGLGVTLLCVVAAVAVIGRPAYRALQSRGSSRPSSRSLDR